MGETAVFLGMKKTVLSSVIACAMLALGMSSAQAQFEKIADLNAVSVSTDANFLVTEGRALLRTWVRLDFKEDQRFEPTPNPLSPGPTLAYRSRMDYVQVDCQRNLYGELATQMFSDAEAKGQTVFESTGMRSANPRFATPSSHEGVVLLFLCKGVKPQG